MSAAMAPPEALLPVVITVFDSPERRAMKRRRPRSCVWSRARAGNPLLQRPSRGGQTMFERFKRDSDGSSERTTATAREERAGNGRTAVAERPATTTRHEEPATRRHAPGSGATTAAAGGVATREHMHTARERQREEYGGINWGAAFFGWLVAVGLGSLLVAILAAAGTAVGLSQNVSGSDATANAES